MFHFLHIRKTGGTAIKQALRELAEGNAMVRLHPHKTRLRDIPEGEKVFFFLRDPLTRFVSGFNSRLRQGKPRYDSPWDEKEKIAFGHFSTANDLAEALFTGPLQKQAEQAMTDIRHINQPYAYWLESIAYVSSRISDLVYVGFQETLAADFERLKEILGLPRHCILPADAVQAHKTPEGYETTLTDQAVQNLKKWCAEDYAYIALFEKLKTQAFEADGNVKTPTRPSVKNNRSDPGRTGPQRNSRLGLCRDTDKILELTQYWFPPVPPWKPLKKTLNSSLRMACLVEERLYQGLRFEGTIMLLTPSNWRQVLKYGKPDFLLVESIWISATGHWHMGQCPGSPYREEIVEIVRLASQLGTPTVFWITKGHEYHAHYKEVARRFDHVFCADPLEVDLLRTEGVSAHLLPPCVQPAMYNAFRHYEYYDAMRLGILYDGWADLDRMTDQLRIIEEIKPYGLHIIESRYQIFRRRVDALTDYKNFILGCVTEKNRILAMKYASAYLTLEKTLSTQTTQQWKSLEAAACRLPVIHYGSLPVGDIRKGIISEFPAEISLLLELVRFQEDDFYRQRIAHLACRKVYLKHTFSHRINEVCRKIGITHDWTEFPKASLITPTFRGEFLNRILKNYDRQTYPNKELILVYNDDQALSHSALGLNAARDDIKITSTPTELFAGACLNQGHLLAKGNYFFRMDDDDDYGPNYVFDMMLQSKIIDPDLFGKSPAPILFEDDNTIYERNNSCDFCIVPSSVLAAGKLRIGGNSIAGSHKMWEKFHYQNTAYGAADSSLMHSINPQDKLVCALMDHFNLVAERRMDKASHTWKEPTEKLKSIKSINSKSDLFV
jgi:hypothetical protein